MPEKFHVNDIGILGNWDAMEIAARIKNGEVSKEEVLECVHTRLEKANPIIKAAVASDFDATDAPEGGIFDGVPMFIKDLVNVKGFPTRHGSSAIPDNIHKKDEKVVEQIRQLGCPIIGKSATSEFGLLPSCETLVNGNTKNPHHLEYSCGGSSGGAGALVAAGVVPIAHTMDGGGSTRIPASCCGLIGLKPTKGTHCDSPTKGLPIDIVTHGIVSRTVRDSAGYLFGIQNSHSQKGNAEFIQGPSQRRLKIAVFLDSPVGIEAHEDVSKVVLHTAAICKEMGHSIHHIKNPHSDKVLLDFLTYYSMLARGINWGGKLTYNKGFKRKKVEMFTKELSDYFSKFMFLAPGAIKRLKKNLLEEYNRQFEEYDLVLSPVLNQPVPKLGFFGTDVPIISMTMRLNNFVNYTVVQNATGAPAISLPMGFCRNGLPIGAMFGARIGDEKTLLELSYELEAAQCFKM